MKCIVDAIQLTNVPAGYSEPNIDISDVPGTVKARVAQVVNYNTAGQISIAVPSSDTLWVMTEVAQASINVYILQFYTDS